MAFKKLESNSSGSIPFFNEWKEEVPKDYATFLVDKLVEVLIIKHVQSGKGFMLNFDHTFSVFVWKNSPIGKAIKKMIADETGNILLLQFTQTKKGLNYELGFDEEIEVAVTEDKYDEGVYFTEVTSEYPSIAPIENRSMLATMPLLLAKPPVVFTPTPKSTNKHKPRSDGDG